MKSINNKDTGCNGPQSGSNCTIWQGSDVPLFGIKKGDTITNVMCAILNKLEEVAAPLDLSTVSIQCLKDKLGAEEPIQRTLANMLQLAYDTDCQLKDLIDLAIAKIDGTAANLVLDLKCLAQFDSFGNALTYTEQSVLQLLINSYCSTNDQITTLSGKLTTLQSQVNAINVTPYTEPLVTSCLFSNKPASQAVIIVASDVCNYKTIIGQVTDVQQYIGLTPSDWNQKYGLTPNWISAPANAIQKANNDTLVLQNLEARIAAMENGCCKISCDSIIIDFDIKLSDDRTQATLFFATKSLVPTGFHEVDPLGTKLVITDSGGNTYTTRVKIADQLINADGLLIDLNASPIDPSLDYTFGMNVTMTNGSLTCVKCVSKQAIYKETCAFCEITADPTVGTSSSTAIITYQEIGSTKTKMIVLHPGDTQVIKKHSKILSVATDGSIVLSSPCGIDLNATETYICAQVLYAFTFGSVAAAWEASPQSDVELVEIGYLDQKISIGGGKGNINTGPNAGNLIKAALPVGVSLYTASAGNGSVSDRQKYKLLLKIPSSLLSSFYLKFEVADFSPVKVFAQPCDSANGACCPAPDPEA